MKKPGRARSRQAGTIASAVAALFAASIAPQAYANPTGAQVVSGSVSVNSPSAGQMNITQGTPNAIVNWSTFSIGAGESVTIAQPSATAALLNRVVGNDVSTIAGHLSANGRVFLVNPAGVIFAPGSSVNVGSMIASTLNVSDADFLAGRFRFVGTSPTSVSNAGTLTAQDGGTIALLGGTVSNTGTVSARLGTVALGAGSDITVDFAGDGLTTLQINQGVAHALVGNAGTLAADGGTVVMSAQTATALAGTVLNQQGVVRANSVAERDGHIFLDGGSNGVTLVSGTLDATGGAGLTGGRIDVTGHDVALLSGANVDVSGDAGGGTVRFGGGAAGADPTIRNADAVWMSSGAAIHADALTNGNGGHVVAYGDSVARLYGTMSAKGGAQGGNGGLVETSSRALDTTGLVVDASAPHGAGGTWLLDPVFAEIVSVGYLTTTTPTTMSDTAVTFGPYASYTQITSTTIENELNAGTSVTVRTGTDPTAGAGDIRVDDFVSIQKTSGGDAKFSLQAAGSVVIGYGVTIQATAPAGKLDVLLDSNVDGTGAGSTVDIGGFGSATTVGTNGGKFAVNGNGGNGDVGLTNVSVTTQGGSVQLADSLSSGGSVSIGSQSSITTGGGNVTLTGSSTVDLTNSIVDTQGGNVRITGGSSASGTGVTVESASISSDGGNVTIDGTSTVSFTSGISIWNSSVTTTGGAVSLTGTLNVPSGSTLYNPEGGLAAGIDIENNASVTTGSGAISLTGNLNVPTNVTIPVTFNGAGTAVAGDSTISSTSGAISLTGTATGDPANANAHMVGVALDGNTDGTPGSVTTGSGTLSIHGSGVGTQTEGVLIADGFGIMSTNGGNIDIRGVATGVPGPGGQPVGDFGVLMLNGGVLSSGTSGDIAITGSTNTSDPGVAIGYGVSSTPFGNFSTFAGPVAITSTNPGTITLRSANDGTTSSLSIVSFDGSPVISSANGTLVVAPAAVDPANNYAITPLDAVPITLLDYGPGLGIDPTTFSNFSGFQSMIFGSTTQTGRITVNGVCGGQLAIACFLTKPTFTTNLTLSNTGAGSQGIVLPYGISMPGYTLTLASAGPVTDPGGIQAAGLLLSGPGSFTLTDPQNAVGVLAMSNAGNVDFSNSAGFAIGPILSKTYNSANGQLETIDATNSTLTGNLVATAATGGISLGGGTAAPNGPTGGLNTNLTVGGSADLVMENGVFTNAGTGTISAGNAWRIWAQTWNGETRGNVQPNTAQPNFYGCLFGAGCSWGGTVPSTGNHFVYAQRPTMTVTANDATRTALSPNPTFTYTTTGLINGDTTATLIGGLTTPATLTSPIGTYPIDPNFTSSVGYVVNRIPGTLTVLPVAYTWSTLASGVLQAFFGHEEQTFVYENNLQGTNICIGSTQPLFTTAPPGEKQDLLAVEWKRVRQQPNLNSCMITNGEHGCGDF